jgi:hypothetical protein
VPRPPVDADHPRKLRCIQRRRPNGDGARGPPCSVAEPEKRAAMGHGRLNNHEFRTAAGREAGKLRHEGKQRF